METLDTLCKFFDVTPNKVFLFSKYDTDISIDSLNSEFILSDEKPDIGIEVLSVLNNIIDDLDVLLKAMMEKRYE